MIGTRTIALNTFFLTLASVVNLCISIATTSIIARSIGPELYGRYTFGLTYVMMFSVLANLGLESLYIREAARDRANLVLINDIFHLKIVVAIATILTILVSAYALNYPPATITVLYILCIGLFFQILSESLLSVYRAVERLHVNAIIWTFFRIASAIIIGFSVYFNVGFYGIVAAFSIGNAVVFLVALNIFWRDYKLLNMVIRPSQWIVLLKDGLPFYISSLLSMLYAKINVIILSKLVSDQEMGFYMAAISLVESLYFIPNAFTSSAFPAFSRLYGASYDSLKKIYNKIIKYIIILSVAVTVGTILISEKIIFLIYGSQFTPAVRVLNIAIFLWVLNFLLDAQSILLWAIKKEKILAKIMLFAVIISVILNFFLINIYGYIGAPIALVLTNGIIVCFISVILWKNKLYYIPDLRIFCVIFAAAGMFISVNIFLQYNIVFTIIAGAISYIGTLFILKIFDDEDIYYMKSLVIKRPAH